MNKVDELENDIGIDSCQNVIQHHSISSSPSFLYSSDGKGLKNIEKAKEKETCNNQEDCLWNPQHRDEESHHLIDHDSGIIFFPKKYFSIFRNPNGKKEKSNKSGFIDWRWNGREEIINRDGDERAHRPRGKGRIPNAKSGRENEEETIDHI